MLSLLFFSFIDTFIIFPYITILSYERLVGVHSQKKGFFNGSSKWPKVLPGTFCYLNQAKGSPNYTQL